MSGRAGLAIALFALVAGCAPNPSPQTLQWVALGTLIEVTVADPTPGWRDRLSREIKPWLEDWGVAMYAFGEGELAQANAIWRTGGCTNVSIELRRLIDLARQLEQRHPDLFVPALADLARLWRLHELDDPDWAPPDQSDVAAITSQSPRTANLVANADGLCASAPLALDVGGFAKGVALDRIADTLLQLGHTRALINIGGDLRVLGRRYDGAWRLGVRDPDGDGALAAIAAYDGDVVVTSGNYARGATVGSTRYGHILDPLTGQPAAGIASVTVIGREATATDAAATALFVAAARSRASGGLARLPPVADAGTYLIVDTDGHVVASASMLERVSWRAAPPKITVVR